MYCYNRFNAVAAAVKVCSCAVKSVAGRTLSSTLQVSVGLAGSLRCGGGGGVSGRSSTSNGVRLPSCVPTECRRRLPTVSLPLLLFEIDIHRATHTRVAVAQEESMDMEGHHESVGAVHDTKLSKGTCKNVTVPESTSSCSKSISAFFCCCIPTRKKQHRRGNAASVVLAQEERVGTEGRCKSSGAGLQDAESLSKSMPTAPEGLSECRTATLTEVRVVSTSSCEPLQSNCVSSRIEGMMQRRSEYATALEFEIEASKDHWSQLDPISTVQNVDEMPKWRYDFFVGFKGFPYEHFELGDKIAEGGQAEIFFIKQASGGGDKGSSVVKVFKKDYTLREVRKLWPDGMVQHAAGWKGFFTANTCYIHRALVLRDGRVAIQMDRYWGDLRKLIDYRMQQNINQFPPFTSEEVQRIVVQIARGMNELQELNITHRDLKASNVLVYPHDWRIDEFDPGRQKFNCVVADFECSVGVVGTRWWRAPEILQALQCRDIKPHLFTEKVDVYGYAMTCYEVLTGCIPFEGEGGIRFGDVIAGRRPDIPNHVHPLLKTLLTRCWHGNPSERPSFKDIKFYLKEIYPDCRF